MGMKTPGGTELKRFALHVLFGAAVFAVGAALADMSRLHLDPTTTAILTAIGTSAAAFFKKQADAEAEPVAVPAVPLFPSIASPTAPTVEPPPVGLK